MHFSAILVLTRPERIPECIRQLETLAGVEVRHTDIGSGRIIAVLESAGLEEQKDLLRRVQRLETVLLAELVYHYRETEAGESQPSGGRSHGRTLDETEQA